MFAMNAVADINNFGSTNSIFGLCGRIVDPDKDLPNRNATEHCTK
jgi:hypothetical protein